MNCDINLNPLCACGCHGSGIKFMYSTNPPTPCCLCEAMQYAPIKQQCEWEVLIERLKLSDERIKVLEDQIKYLVEAGRNDELSTSSKLEDLHRKLNKIQMSCEDNRANSISAFNTLSRHTDQIKELYALIQHLKKSIPVNDAIGRDQHRCVKCETQYFKIFVDSDRKLIGQCLQCQHEWKD